MVTPSDTLRAVADVLGDRASLMKPLGPLTTYGVGGPAALYVEVEGPDDLETVRHTLRGAAGSRGAAGDGIATFVIGRGSNLLVSDAGFDGMSASTSLAYVAAMQEHGVPITYAYISDAHDNHGVSGNQHVAFGPGSAGYVAQLKSYDDAFAAFFQRLANDGITKQNTLFVFTVDEGDHFVGVQQTNCDGIDVIVAPPTASAGTVQPFQIAGQFDDRTGTAFANMSRTLTAQQLASAERSFLWIKRGISRRPRFTSW